MTTVNAAVERKLKNVLVVVKKSAYQTAVDTKDQHTLKLIEQGDETVASYLPAHQEQEATMPVIRAALEERGIAYRIVQRGALSGDPQDVNLVIVVGGDGTFLDASHSLVNVPLLGVIPTATSYGHFCLANRSTFASVLDEIESGARAPERLLRLEASINGMPVKEPILNEVAFGKVDWFDMSRYIVTVGSKHEEHKSNGMFIGPASGSTGSLSSAGALALPITARQFLYQAILPWTPPGVHYELGSGILKEGEEIVFQMKMTDALIGIDGKFIRYPLTRGDKLVIRANTKDLLAYVDPNVNDAAIKEQQARRALVKV
jgi:NAD+ kinase